MAMSFKTKIIGSVVIPTIVLIALSAVALAFNAYQNQQQAAAGRVAKSDESVSRAVDRLRI